MSAANKKIINWLKNKNQRFRENICAPIVFKLLDLIGFQRHLPFTCTGDDAQELIYRKLISGKPCMIGRIGATEIRSIEGSINQDCPLWQKIKLFLTFHQTKISSKIKSMWGGIEEHNDDLFYEKFANLVHEDILQLDIFASWRWEETTVLPDYSKNVIALGDLEPFFSSSPWTRALAGRKVLVIHPFVKAIEYQYSRREYLFANSNILPNFTLKTYQPFYVGVRENADGTYDFFRNLECMKKEISEIDFDIALIAAGPFGFSLAAEIKRNKKQAIVVGGVLQILFGIKGNRWDSSPEYSKLYNEYWIRPGDETKTKNFIKIDGGCYW